MSHDRYQPLDEPANILLIRFKSIGDVLFTLPAVNRVRDNFPHARITFLVAQELAPLLRGFSAVDEVVPLDRAIYRQRQLRAMMVATLELMRRLRRGRFSLAVDFQGYGETALLAWLTRAPQRWGSVYRPGRQWAYTQGVWRNDHIHPAQWNLSLLTQCGLRETPLRNEFHLPESEVRTGRLFFSACGYDPARPTLFIQPFTSSPPKNWPLEKYLALARHWRAGNVQVIFGGGPADGEALAAARAEAFPVSAGVPLLTTASLIKLSILVVGGDTGLLHLAVAMGKRVLMLRQGCGERDAIPWGHPEWVLATREGRSVAEIELAEAIQSSTNAFRECGIQ